MYNNVYNLFNFLFFYLFIFLISLVNKDYNMPSEFIDFVVKVKKEGKKSGLIGEFTYLEDELSVSNISFSEDIDNDLIHMMSTMKYHGPEFNILDELFQKRLANFFQDFGVNEKLAHFLIKYSTIKDSNLYNNWLEEIKSFI